MKRKYKFLILALFVLTACGTAQTGDSDETVEVNVVECVSCSANVSVLLSTNFPNQVHSDYRSHVSAGSALARGDLYARLCADSACSNEFDRIAIASDILLSTGFPQSQTITGLPIGSYFVQLLLDTELSQDNPDACAGSADDCVSAFDVLQTAATSIEANNSEQGDASLNPSAIAVSVTVSQNQTSGLSQIYLGHLYFPARSVPAADAERPRTLVPYGDSTSRPRVAVIDVSTDEPERTLEIPQVDDEDFGGNICGIVPGSERVYLAAEVDDGFYLFDYDSTDLTQATAEPTLIPEPDCAPNAIACFPAVPEAQIDVPSFPAPCVEHDLTNDETEEETLFASAGWRHEGGQTRIYRNDETPTLLATAGTFTGSCGGIDEQQAAIITASVDGTRHTFVGNDDSISVFDASHTLLGTIDTSDYGQVITDFALSPDGATLYAVPACKSDAQGTLSSRTQSQDSDRHRVVVLDLTVDTDNDNLPDLKFTTRDFDNDGTADGGIDLEFLHLKQDILNWCPGCFGVLPPTAITLPRIVASENYLYLRGNMNASSNVSGLGQMGDVAVFDLATGEGIIYQNYQPWLDGASSRWGVALDSDEARTAGFIVAD